MSDQNDLLSLPRSTQFAFVLGLAFVGMVIYDQIFYWSTMEDYSFGYLVPIFVGYVVFDRWPKLKALLFGENEGHTDTPVTPLMRVTEVVMGMGLVLSLLMYFFGGLILASQGATSQGSLMMAVGLGGIVLGLAFMVAKEDVKGRKLSWDERMTFTFLFLFPALAWLVSAPMVMYLNNDVAGELLKFVTIIVYNIFNFLGFTLVPGVFPGEELATLNAEIEQGLTELKAMLG